MKFCLPRYLAKNFRICYNANRQTNDSTHRVHKKPPVCADTGGSPFLKRRLKPLLPTHLHPATYKYSKPQCWLSQRARMTVFLPHSTPPFRTCLGVVAQLLYHRTMRTERLYLKYILGQWRVNSNKYVTIKSVIIISL